MTPQMASALLAYLQRYSGIPGGTLGEHQQICMAIPVLESIASGQVIANLAAPQKPDESKPQG